MSLNRSKHSLHTRVAGLIAVSHPDHLRQTYARICAALLLLFALVGGLLVVVGVAVGASRAAIGITAALSLALVSAWWVNRRGHLLGPVAIVAAAVLLTVTVYDPTVYVAVSGRPIVHLGFALPVILASIFVHALAGYPTAVVTVAFLSLKGGAAGFEPGHVLAFAVFAGVQLALIATMTALVAWAVSTSLRSVRQVRLEREQRIAERTSLLESQTARAHRLLNERKALYSSVAHDLRRDAMLLIDLTDQLVEAWKNRDHAEAAAHERRLVRFVRRQAAYAQDITDVSLVAEGVPLPMRPTLVSLPELAVRLADDLVPEARQHQITLSVETRPEAMWAWCDSERTERVLRNLIGNAMNAVKASGQPGSVTITVARQSDSLLRCDVVDTGCGIAAEDLRRLGHRFVRVRLPGMDGDGMGLGLTLSAQLVSLMGGNLFLTSPGIGFGAVASFTLPAYVLQEGADVVHVDAHPSLARVVMAHVRQVTASPPSP